MLGEIHARNCAEKQTMLEANIYVCWMSSVLVANTCLSGDVMPRRTIKLAEEFQAFFFLFMILRKEYPEVYLKQFRGNAN
jgi:hypothetical protein